MSTSPGGRHPARAGLTRDVDDNGALVDLLFDPDSAWFADVPLIRVLDGGRWEIVRGRLSDAERAAVTTRTSRYEPGATAGVFTNALGDIAVVPAGTALRYDPRDVHRLDTAWAYYGRDIGDLARRLRELADWLDDAAARGWVLRTIDAGYSELTNAPDRAPVDVSDYLTDDDAGRR